MFSHVSNFVIGDKEKQEIVTENMEGMACFQETLLQ